MARVALVTGAAGGIGASLARELARAGWRVVGCYRSRDDRAEALLDVARRESWIDRISLRRCDIGDADARRAWCRGALDAEGRCDALVHAAGPFLRAPLLEQTDADLASLYETNVVALHALTREVAPAMRSRGWGRVLAFGLASTHRGAAPPSLAAYYCAKQAATSMTRALARELAPFGVTANVLSPGVIDSGGLPPGELERLRPSIPAGYVGEARDAVAAAMWLLSDEARYVSGTEVLVSGAWGL
ncbi:MAG: SDR family oxidoreductase [Polyangiales bacterium]